MTKYGQLVRVSASQCLTQSDCGHGIAVDMYPYTVSNTFSPKRNVLLTMSQSAPLNDESFQPLTLGEWLWIIPFILKLRELYTLMSGPPLTA